LITTFVVITKTRIKEQRS